MDFSLDTFMLALQIFFYNPVNMLDVIIFCFWKNYYVIYVNVTENSYLFA